MDEVKSHHHAYFPASKEQTLGHFRNIFSSYGALNHLHIYSNDDILHRRSPVLLNQEASSLKATGPSLPLFPPGNFATNTSVHDY